MDVDASDSSMEFNDNDSTNGENADTENVNSDGENEGTECDYDIWSIINGKIDNENVSDDARKNRGLRHFLYFIRCGLAWRRDRIYKAILMIFRKHKLIKVCLFKMTCSNFSMLFVKRDSKFVKN